MYLETIQLIHVLVLTIFLFCFVSLLFSFATFTITYKLSTSFDNEIDINLRLSINSSFYVILLPLSSSFLIGNEKVIYFSVFSPKHSN